MLTKILMHFFADKEVRSIWDSEKNIWWFAVPDIIDIISESTNHARYWRVFKSRLRKAGSETVTNCNALKLCAAYGKMHLTDTLDDKGIIALAKEFPGKKANHFIEWFTCGDDTIDVKSKQKAYALFEISILGSIEFGPTNGLKQIHAHIFVGLCNFADKIRDANISKGGFTFVPVRILADNLKKTETILEATFEQLLDKYVEMNVVHTFREVNGRSMRIWLDLILKKNLKKCVDWSMIGRKEYLASMQKSVSNSTDIKALILPSLSDKINDREAFMKGVDYSYYYEEADNMDLTCEQLSEEE
ncbi:MAG: Fic family protein [Christensenellaceae bacterium]|jgi:cell filamentation protein|nr:Fic family protein [Christensenellaceae bacterium]